VVQAKRCCYAIVMVSRVECGPKSETKPCRISCGTQQWRSNTMAGAYTHLCTQHPARPPLRSLCLVDCAVFNILHLPPILVPESIEAMDQFQVQIHPCIISCTSTARTTSLLPAPLPRA
jgi:hypothetical protein